MPRGDEEEIAARDGGVFRFLALPATRALLEWPIEPVIDSQQVELDSEYL